MSTPSKLKPKLETVEFSAPLKAEAPNPSRFISWCLSFPLPWVRKKAQTYYLKQVGAFRAREYEAIQEAAIIARSVEKNLNIDDSVDSARHQLNYLNASNAKMCEQIRTFPEVQKILKSIYTKVLDIFKPKTKEAPQPVKEYYSPILTKTKSRVMGMTEDHSGAVEVRKLCLSPGR